MRLVKSKDVPEMGVAHNPEIKKRVFVEKGIIPNLYTFGEATFLPGQSVDLHLHETAFEVFYITSGKAVFTISNQEYEVEAGDCITIDPHEEHKQANPFENSVTWTYLVLASE